MCPTGLICVPYQYAESVAYLTGVIEHMVNQAKQYSRDDVESRYTELSTFVARPLRLDNLAQPSIYCSH